MDQDKKDLLITGFPRSGTSYFCSLLNKIDNFAVVNEPDQEDYNLLEVKGLSNFYKKLRLKIKNGASIKNKVVEDTRIKNIRMSWFPKYIKNDSFRVGMKRTIPVLFALSWLIREYKDIKIITLVRNPYDNISSWKNSFLHIKMAQVKRMSYFFDPKIYSMLFSEDQKKAIETMKNTSDTAVRRCLFWNFLAESIIAHRNKINIIKYENLIKEPIGIISNTFNLAENQLGRIEKSTQKKNPCYLTAEDKSLISTHCRGNALKLGYDI
jgi:hypothetical protein